MSWEHNRVSTGLIKKEPFEMQYLCDPDHPDSGYDGMVTIPELVTARHFLWVQDFDFNYDQSLILHPSVMSDEGHRVFKGDSQYVLFFERNVPRGYEHYETPKRYAYAKKEYQKSVVSQMKEAIIVLAESEHASKELSGIDVKFLPVFKFSSDEERVLYGQGKIQTERPVRNYDFSAAFDPRRRFPIASFKEIGGWISIVARATLHFAKARRLWSSSTKFRPKSEEVLYYLHSEPKAAMEEHLFPITE
jgi:hypothetical protein